MSKIAQVIDTLGEKSIKEEDPMAGREKPMPSPDSIAGFLLTLTAFSGEVPLSLVDRLPITDYYKRKMLIRLKEKKLIRTYYNNDLRGLRLTYRAKDMLSASQPDRYADLFSGDSATNAPKYSVSGRMRLHRMAEVLLLMHNAGAVVFPWEKPPVFQPARAHIEYSVDRPTYYSSREVKAIGPQSGKIRGSRATGILLTDGGIFVVYNTAAAEMKWEYKAEMRLKALLQIELCQTRLSKQYQGSAQDAIVFGADMKQMERLMGIGSKATRSFFVLDGNFEHFYFLTSDRHGEVLLQMLCTPMLCETLNKILMENLSASRPDWTIVNDGFDENGAPVLFGYTCDMPRIKRFDTALALHDRTGTLVCFDFQEGALRRICGERVSIQCIDFNAFEGSVLYLTQETD